MVRRLKFRDLLARESESFFWIRSANVFRLSVPFSQMIYQYLVKLDSSHQNNRVHQWENNTIARNLRFVEGDQRRISFHEDPVEASDFVRQREKDYQDLAAFIEMVHDFYGLQDISEEQCPEIVSFLNVLNNSAGRELWIKSHYCLWDFHKRFEFYEKLQKQYRQSEFKEYFDAALEQHFPVALEHTYPNGFWEEFNDEPLLYDVCQHDVSSYFPNGYPDLFRYARNLGAHYSSRSRRNPHNEREAEWLFYKKFPFLLKQLCEALITLGIYQQFI